MHVHEGDCINYAHQESGLKSCDSRDIVVSDIFVKVTTLNELYYPIFDIPSNQINIMYKYEYLNFQKAFFGGGTFEGVISTFFVHA